jgi:O-acetyl-ADP-ribose deacetylase (regulator of RNase III)
MDGGIDIVLRDRFPLVESRVQDAIADLGEPLHVGMCLTIETGDLDVPYLLFAPTMLFPSVVAHTNNAHRAMLAILEEAAEQSIGSVAIPGLCTGVGSMHPDDAATQMAAAYTFWLAHAQ